MSEFVEFYARSGCMVSLSLLHKLRRAGVHLRVHDIWADDADAAFVRSVARGNETVPTVVVGDAVFVAPSARTVLTEIAASAPHLRDEAAAVPSLWERVTRWGRA